MRGFHKKKDSKDKIPLKEQDISNNKISRERLSEQTAELLHKKDGKE